MHIKFKGSVLVQQFERYRMTCDKARDGKVSKMEWAIADSANNFFLNAAETRHVIVEKDFTKIKDE